MKQENQITVSDIIMVKNALAEVIAEETSLTETMQIIKVAELQDKKLKLIGLLERYLRNFKKETLTSSDIEDLKNCEEKFKVIMKKNYDTLLVARAVNLTVVKCVSHIHAGRGNNQIYNFRGVKANAYRGITMSMTLNQIA